METEGIRFEILAETKGLDAALNKIEQSTDGLAKKLNTGFNIADQTYAAQKGLEQDILRTLTRWFFMHCPGHEVLAA